MSEMPDISPIWQGHPLRVMQVHSLYPVYLPWYYGKYPKVREAPFAVQTKAFLKHGLFALHMLTEELETRGCETMMVFANAMPLQCKWAEENGFPDLAKSPTWLYDILEAQVLSFKPDVLYVSDNHDVDAAFLARLSTPPPVVCGWRCASVELGTDWTGYDVIFSMLDRILLLAPLLGAGRAEYMDCGYPEWLGKKVDKIPQDTDVVFHGTYLTEFAPSQHEHRRQMLDRLMQSALDNSFTLGMGISEGVKHIAPAFKPFLREATYGVDMQLATRRGRMALDVQGWVSARLGGKPLLRLTGGETATMRLFESTGGGSLTFTEKRGRLQKLFPPDALETFADSNELLAKVLWYKAHPAERERVAQRGMEHCRSRFSKKNQVDRFLAIVKEILAEKKQGRAKPGPVHAAIERLAPPPDAQIQRLLRLLQSLPATDTGLAQAIPLEHELFSIACRQLYSGNLDKATALDKAVAESPAIQYDLGAITPA